MLICDKCGEHIPVGANFCPRCADPVTEADVKAEPEVTQAQTSILIRFGQSSSGRHSDAVALAQKVPTYCHAEDGSHEVTLGGEDVALAASLWELVGGWKTSRMTINGERATKKDLTYGALGCFQKRQQSFRPSQYCFGETEFEQNLWGCHRLGMPLAAWGQSWLCWGKFDSSGRWHWDRDRLSHELEKGIHEHRYCPALKPDAIRAALKALPDGIHPPSSGDWNYVKEWEGTKEVPVGVAPTLKTAKRLAAGDEVPAWMENASLSRATSKLDRFDDVAVAIRQPSQTQVQKPGSGCVGMIAIMAGIPLMFLLSVIVVVVA